MNFDSDQRRNTIEYLDMVMANLPCARRPCNNVSAMAQTTQNIQVTLMSHSYQSINNY